MFKKTPLYPLSRKDSKSLGEHEKWFESYQANCSCARSIEIAIKDAYSSNDLDAKCAESIINHYGFDRTNWVLAHTIQQCKIDTRFAQNQHLWANKFRIPYDDNYIQCNFVVNMHPCLVSLFVDIVRELWKNLNLYEQSHCYNEENAPLDYTGKIVVIQPRMLCDENKKPDNQLFYAKEGNGCKPLAFDSKIFGEFLKSGAKKVFLKSDIIGVLKLDLLPEWAQQRYLKITTKRLETI